MSAAPFRVAVCKNALSTGRGADRAVIGLMNGLSERGYAVTLVTCQAPDVPFSAPLDARIRVTRVAPDAFAAAADAAGDVVVSTGTDELVPLAACTRPVVHQFHVYPPFAFKWRHPLRNRRIRRALERAAAIQVLVKGHVATLPAALRPRTAVIGNWPSYRPETDAPSPDRPVILCPAACNRDKNQLLLLRAFARVAGDFPAWTLELYGTARPSYQAKLQRFIARCDCRQAGFSGRVAFRGYGDLDAAYRRCAFVAFPSRVEGFGLAVAEAAAYARPAVALAGAPGVNELVLTGETGFLCERTPASFAAALGRLMEDAALRRRLGEAARRRCRQCWSREKILDAWEGLLTTCARTPDMV